MIDFTTTTATSGNHYASQAALTAMKGTKNVITRSNAGAESSTVADDDRIEAALAFADRFIDQYLGGLGFVTPITDARPLASLSDIAVQIAFAYLVDADVWRVADGPDAGPGRELFFAKREAKARLAHLAAFGMATCDRNSGLDARPAVDGQ